MITKVSGSEKKHLIVIQFLDKDEPSTGRSLATIINQDCSLIGKVDFRPFSNNINLLSFIESDLQNLIDEDEDVILYIDSHGTANGDGIATRKDGFINWDTLLDVLKIPFEKFGISPILILTACNGIGIKKQIDSIDKPFCSKLIAGTGVMEDGPTLEALRTIIEKKGTNINGTDIEEANRIIISREPQHPLLKYVEYQ